MLESIEKQRESKPSKAVVTVMFHDRTGVLGGNDSPCAREDAAPSLSKLLALVFDALSDALSQPGSLTFAQQTRSRDRTRSRSLSRTKKFSAEGPMARSALPVLAANPNTRSTQAAATVITTMTEQRRCVAA